MKLARLLLPVLVKPESPPTLPDKPSIAVLPFQNMSGDPEQEHFADSMVEEIITALSRFRWLFVIARSLYNIGMDRPWWAIQRKAVH